MNVMRGNKDENKMVIRLKIIIKNNLIFNLNVNFVENETEICNEIAQWLDRGLNNSGNHRKKII